MFFFSYDSLTIYDGGSSTSSMMGKYCGDSIPPSHVSSSNEVLIHFHSDEYVTETGFKIEYNPTGKQDTSIQNNTDYHIDRCSILGICTHVFKEAFSRFQGNFIFCRKVIKIAKMRDGLFLWHSNVGIIHSIVLLPRGHKLNFDIETCILFDS